MESKLTNGGKPHICGTLQVHKAPKNGVALCTRCNLPVDEVCEECGGTGEITYNAGMNGEDGRYERIVKCKCKIDL